MTVYEFHGNYEAFRDGRRFGPWVEGDRVHLDPADAAWIDRDSPGVLSATDDDTDLVDGPAVAGGARPRHSGDPDGAVAAAATKQRLDAESVFRQTATGDGVLPGADEDTDETDVPDGSAAQVLAWVNGDPDRAQTALDVEVERETPRVTLTAALEKIADRAQAPDADRQHRGGVNR